MPKQSVVGGGQRWVVLRRPLAGLVDLAALFTTVFDAPGRRVWLDSGARGSGSGRYSFAGAASQRFGVRLSYDVDGAGVVLERFDGRPPELLPGDVFELLADVLAQIAVDPDEQIPFVGGLVGWFGYELKADLGMPGPHRAATPDAAWLLIDRLVVLDHDTGQAVLLALVPDDAAGRADGITWLGRAAARCADAALPLAPVPPVTEAPASFPSDTSQPAAGGSFWQEYVADIEACKRALQAGQSYEICLTASSSLPFDGDAFELYLALRRANPAPYAAFLDVGGVQVVSASPERFLHLDGSGRLETRPIKGTAARHRNPLADAAAAAALAADAKTVAENIVVVDLLRNDLHRVCEPGTVETSRLLEVESYPRVHQLVSAVQGRLRSGLGPLDAVRACFPGGSMTGAPKRRTCEIIDELEGGPRGVYSGAAGYLSASGVADLAIVIRTAVVHDGRVSVGAGGGIVLDSDPDDEFEEMRLKAESTWSVIRSVRGGAAGAAAR